MKYKKTITSIAFLILGLGGLQAQKTVTTAGNKATGIGGTASYTVGQVVYTAGTGTNGSVEQGVQQPFEISTTLGVNETTINLELSVYPNPTADFLTLKVEKIENLHYQLIDMQGKLIESKTVRSNSSNISLENQPTATYLLKVTKNNHLIKTFKVIKN
ncbi:hypothetical protein BST83_18800 [Polaribacter filamentus]|uniref:Secretion system C-terminal sorting domain-containing protein n=1 Tax=Polaribacter filamentus TaxID=53483 RepID=A0A2S7KL42_9FLAO|nr:T9SS type A sorting domain-containing protein [Polaribacter filamentus]PQB03346.1 hypothetical protein BST83_18800 [Polaribacter filamentus]